jgi:hypothetical protein
MVSTYDNAISAFEALQAECYKPTSSTMRTRKKVVQEGAKVVGGIVAGAAGPVAAVAPLAAPVLKAGAAAVNAVAKAILPSLTPIESAALGGAGAAALGVVQDKAVDAFSGLGDRKDLPMPHNSHMPLVDRAQIKSVLRPGRTLAQVAGNRAGTRGQVLMKELLDSIIVHYQLAMQIWKGPPYKPGEILAPLKSCQEAEDLYRKFMEVDYHFSKVNAYARKFKELADAYVKFCESNTSKLQGALHDCEEAVLFVLKQGPEWHQKHCQVTDHCYRTRKISRIGVSHVA